MGASLKWMAKAKTGPIGLAIKRLREGKRMSQAALGLASGVHPITLAKIESGATTEPDPRTLRKLARALGVRPGDLANAGLVVQPQPLLDAYLQSPWAQIDSPTVEEREWFAALPGVVFHEVGQTPEAVHHLIVARRASR